jgi:hypothetical protein
MVVSPRNVRGVGCVTRARVRYSLRMIFAVGSQESRPDLADDEERRRRRWTLPRSALLWTVFLVLGILFWLSSVGVWNHPAYQLILMSSMFAFCGWVVCVPEVKS